MKFINIKDQRHEILEQIRNEFDKFEEVPCEQNAMSGEWIWCPRIIIKDEVKQ